ncbi:MAG: efflux RND transporter permease subunit, partial [Calditrichaeota bacterium]
FSVAVGVGFIALAGVATEIGVIMLTYLDRAYNQRLLHGRMNSKADLVEAVVEGTALRLRPIVMTMTAIIGGLLPIMWGHGTGSQVMRRIAAPMVGGMATATLLTLLVIPSIYYLWKGWRLPKEAEENPQAQPQV